MSEYGRYLLLDAHDTPLARGVLESPPNGVTFQVLVLDGRADAVRREKVVQLVGSGGTPALAGCVVRSRGERVVLERLHELGAAARRNLRVPVRFETLLYPLDGTWRGRRKVVSEDLSCGGIAFSCREELKEGEQAEIVVPITSQPLVVRCEVLRARGTSPGGTLYAARFVDLCHDEEAMIREAVFSVQLEGRVR